MLNTAFIDDMSSRRAAVRRHIIYCFTAVDGRSVPSTIINLLNEALAVELICVKRYKAHYYASHGFAREGTTVKLADTQFLTQVNKEQLHADRLAERITQLGGVPDFNPTLLARRGYSDYTNLGSNQDTLTEDLIAERIVMAIYREIIKFIADRDPVTRVLLEEILTFEESHAEDLNSRISQAAMLESPSVAAGY